MWADMDVIRPGESGQPADGGDHTQPRYSSLGTQHRREEEVSSGTIAELQKDAPQRVGCSAARYDIRTRSSDGGSTGVRAWQRSSGSRARDLQWLSRLQAQPQRWKRLSAAVAATPRRQTARPPSDPSAHLARQNAGRTQATCFCRSTLELLLFLAYRASSALRPSNDSLSTSTASLPPPHPRLDDSFVSRDGPGVDSGTLAPPDEVLSPPLPEVSRLRDRTAAPPVKLDWNLARPPRRHLRLG